jgi:hypothetical protein
MLRQVLSKNIFLIFIGLEKTIKKKRRRIKFVRDFHFLLKMSKKKELVPERMEGEREDATERQTVTRDYYSSRPNTFDTMLGGYTQVHDADIQESNYLLQSLFKVFSLFDKILFNFIFLFSNLMVN